MVNLGSHSSKSTATERRVLWANQPPITPCKASNQSLASSRTHGCQVTFCMGGGTSTSLTEDCALVPILWWELHNYSHVF